LRTASWLMKLPPPPPPPPPHTDSHTFHRFSSSGHPVSRPPGRPAGPEPSAGAELAADARAADERDEHERAERGRLHCAAAQRRKGPRHWCARAAPTEWSPLARPPVRPFIHLLARRGSGARSPVRPSVRSFICSLAEGVVPARPSVRPHIHSFARLFVRSFDRSFFFAPYLPLGRRFASSPLTCTRRSLARTGPVSLARAWGLVCARVCGRARTRRRVLGRRRPCLAACGPHHIRRALENTAAPAGQPDAFALGAGLIQVDAAFDWLLAHCRAPEAGVSFGVSTPALSANGRPMRGIYFRSYDEVSCVVLRGASLRCLAGPLWDAVVLWR
jgi:hypothetical protein